MSLEKRVLLGVALFASLHCGYTVGRVGAPRRVAVGAVSGSGIDVDAAALIDGAVRDAVARSTTTRLVSAGEAEARLEVELLSTDSPLVAFSDPGLRAAQYRAEVRVRGRLVDPSGRVLWTSDVISGDASHLSPEGRAEALDGARRTALARAAQDAADRLVASLP